MPLPARLRFTLLMTLAVYPVVTLYLYVLMPLTQGWDIWQRSYATKEFPGVGGASLSVLIEDYTSRVIGTCSFSIDGPEREISPPALRDAGFFDRMQGDAADWTGLWQNPEGTLLLRAVMSSNADRFLLSVMTVQAKP